MLKAVGFITFLICGGQVGPAPPVSPADSLASRFQVLPISPPDLRQSNSTNQPLLQIQLQKLQLLKLRRCVLHLAPNDSGLYIFDQPIKLKQKPSSDEIYRQFPSEESTYGHAFCLGSIAVYYVFGGYLIGVPHKGKFVNAPVRGNGSSKIRDVNIVLSQSLHFTPNTKSVTVKIRDPRWTVPFIRDNVVSEVIRKLLNSLPK